MPAPFIVENNQFVRNIVQDGLLERAFADALRPKFLFRADMAREEWGGNVGDSRLNTRRGIIKPKPKPLNPRTDPAASTVSYEQWETFIEQYGDSVDSDLPTNAVAAASTLDSDVHALGISAGQTLNHVARNKLYTAYLGGQTTVDDAGGPFIVAPAASQDVHVRNINGFTQTPILSGRPTPVSAANPIAVVDATVDPLAAQFDVTAAVPDDANDPNGPGTLTLKNTTAGALTITLDDAIIANESPLVIRAGAGLLSALGLVAGDILTLDLLFLAVASLRANNVPTHPDGYYHCHLDPISEIQLFKDPAFRQLNTALPDYVMYRDLAIGELGGILFYRDNETPNPQSVTLGDESIGNDVLVSASGATIRRPVVTGYGAIYEHYIDEMKRFISEAGVTGKVGNFSITNNGIAVNTEGIRYTMRAPLDKLQQVVSNTWSWSGDYGIPSDFLTGTPSVYKRAVVIETGS
jgi:hypothetical protein